MSYSLIVAEAVVVRGRCTATLQFLSLALELRSIIVTTVQTIVELALTTWHLLVAVTTSHFLMFI